MSFYQPTDHGLEAKIAEKLARLRELDAQAGEPDTVAGKKY